MFQMRMPGSFARRVPVTDADAVVFSAFLYDFENIAMPNDENCRHAVGRISASCAALAGQFGFLLRSNSRATGYRSFATNSKLK